TATVDCSRLRTPPSWRSHFTGFTVDIISFGSLVLSFGISAPRISFFRLGACFFLSRTAGSAPQLLRCLLLLSRFIGPVGGGSRGHISLAITKNRPNQSLQPTALWRCASMSILISVSSTVAQPRCQSGG